MANRVNFAGTVVGLNTTGFDKSLKNIEKNLNNTSKQGCADFNKMEKSFSEMTSKFQKMEATFRATGTGLAQIGSTLTGAFRGLAAVVNVAGIAAVISQITSNLQQAEQAVSSLTAVTGRLDTARVLFDDLNNLSREIPQDFNQITQAALTLNKAGLQPTSQNIKSLAAIALGTGQSLTGVAQAMSNAAMGQLRGLRQLGINAVQEGDKLKLTYRGVTETVKADTKSLQQYMNRLAENSFGEVLEYQMEGVTGATKQLGEAWGDLYRALGESGVGDIIIQAMHDVRDILDSVTAKLNSPEWASYIKSIQVLFENLRDGVKSAIQAVEETWDQFIDGLEDSSKEGTDYASTYFKNFFTLVNIGITGLFTSLKEVVSFLPKIGNTIGKALSPDLKRQMAWAQWQEKAKAGEVNLNDAAAFREYEKNYNVTGFSKAKTIGEQLDEAGKAISDAMDKAAKQIVDAGVEKAKKIVFTPGTNGADAGTGTGNKPIGNGESGSGGKGGGGGNSGISKEAVEAKRAFDQLADSMEKARIKSLSVLQQEEIEYQKHIRTIQEALARKAVSEQEAQVLREQLEAAHQERLNQIKLDADARLAAMLGDPTVKLQAQYAQELEALEQLHADKLVSEENFLIARQSLYDQYTADLTKAKDKDKKGKKDKDSKVTVFGVDTEDLEEMGKSLNSVSSAFSGLTSSMDEASSGYKALFAVEKAFSIASAIVNGTAAIGKGMATAKTWYEWAAVYAEAIAMVGNVVSTISSVSMHDKGGTIAPGQYGIVGEIGPELVRGPATVTSRRDTAELLSRTGDITVNLIEDAGRAGQVNQSRSDEQTIIEVCVANIRRGGDIADAISNTYGVARQGV